VTVEDAVAGGCNLFDLDELRLEYSPEEYLNLLMCHFIDDTASIFPLADLQRCMVDSWELWEDFKPLAPRPFAYRPVWVGYDPALSGDSAGLVVVAPPVVPGANFACCTKSNGAGWTSKPRPMQSDASRKISTWNTWRSIRPASARACTSSFASSIRTWSRSTTRLTLRVGSCSKVCR